MQEHLKISLIQADLVWENPDANRIKFELFIDDLVDKTDVIILPEMFNTGFTMNPEHMAEPIEGPTFEWMRLQAKRSNAVITGSVATKDNNGNFYNRLIWMQPDGIHYTYDKRHCFSLANEHLYYKAGTKRLIINYNDWSICPLICYDLRFPVWSRNDVGYDVLLYVANWPQRRSQHWKSLLVARAIENQCYVAGVNRIGNDGGGLYHSGDSSLIDFSGNILWQASDEAAVNTFILSKTELNAYRNNLPFLADQDNFNVLV